MGGRRRRKFEVFLRHYFKKEIANATSWIKVGLVSARSSILLNGSPTSEFSLQKSFETRGPHIAFVLHNYIVMEGLNIALRDGFAANMFRGVKVGSFGIRLSHLFYADDIIIMSNLNQKDMDNIIRILNVFYIASDLKININKSNLYGVWVSSSVVDRMAAGTGCAAGSSLFLILVCLQVRIWAALSIGMN
ncbi:hypothetical protein Tco_1398424 [Tanacetum coccineum]